MKTKTLLYLLLAVTLFTSCSKDDDNDEVFKWDINYKLAVTDLSGNNLKILTDNNTIGEYTENQANKEISKSIDNVQGWTITADKTSLDGDVKTRKITYDYQLDGQDVLILYDITFAKRK